MLHFLSVDKLNMWFWVFGWFLVLTSAIGNGLVIYLVITKPRLHTPGNNFIVSLAVADLCASLAFFPPQFCAKFIYTIDLSHAGLFFKVSFAFLYCSNTNLFAMALDRFLAIATPFRHIYLLTEKTTWSVIVAAWISPFLLFFFPAIFTHNNNPKYTMLVEISRIIIFQILPFVFFVAATFHLLHVAQKVNSQIGIMTTQVRYNHATGAVNNRPPALSNVHFRGSTALIIMVMTAYNVTYIGWNYHCLCHLIGVCQSTKTLNHIVSIALIANTAVNPVLYSFLKKDIQREFSRLFSGKVLNPTEIVGKGHESPRPTTITGR